MGYRINGFEQIKAFYSWVFNNQGIVRPVHVSLYLFFINQNNRSNWVEWFKCPYDLAMQGGCIGSKSTYYKILPELQEWGLIKYKPGINNSKAPLISLIKMYDNEPVTVPLSEPQTEQLTVQLPVPLSGNKYKLITNNIKLIIDNIENILIFLESDKKTKTKNQRVNQFKIDLEPFLDFYGKDTLNKFFLYWTESGKNDKKLRFEKEKSFDISRRLLRWKETSSKKTGDTGRKIKEDLTNFKYE